MSEQRVWYGKPPSGGQVTPEMLTANNNSFQLRCQGTALRWQGQLAEALALYELAVEIDPCAGAWSDWGVTLQQACLSERSLYCLDMALQLEPDDPSRHAYRAHTLFTLGRLDEGWAAFEWGNKGTTVRTSLRPDLANLPQWRPGMPGTVLAYKEQGLGDDIMFGSMLPDLIETTGGQVIIETDERLVGLYQRAFPSVLVTPLADFTDRYRDDLASSIQFGGLGQHFRRSLQDFPCQPFLTADPARVAEMRQWLDSLPGDLKVGMTWRSFLMADARPLEYPLLPEWGPLFDLDGVAWVNLQCGADNSVAGELQRLERNIPKARRRKGWQVHRPPIDLRQDIEGVAALIVALDGVVGCGNNVTQLAGALGEPVYAMGLLPGWPMMGGSEWPWVPMDFPHKTPYEGWENLISGAVDWVQKRKAPRS